MKNLLHLSLCQLIVFVFANINCVAQNTTVTDSTTYNPQQSAILDVQSSSKGMLVPRLTASQRTTISNPATGLLVFDTDSVSFYFYNGSSWQNLSTPGATSNSIWTANSDKVFLNNQQAKVGIGTNNPVAKLTVTGDASTTVNDTLFVVRNKNGEPVFAVFPEGVHVWMADGAKGNAGGFAVSGRSSSKNINEYFKITTDSTRIYIDYDSVSKGNAGGFAVSGRSSSKAELIDFFNISGSNSPDTINPSQARMVWYPKKEAFWAGRVLIKHPDSVGLNSTAIGFENQAKGNWSQAFGYGTKTTGNYSAAIGRLTHAIGYNSIALGDSSVAIGHRSFSLGYGSVAQGIGSMALGTVAVDNTGTPTNFYTRAEGNFSFAAGMGAKTSNIAFGSLAIGSLTNADGPACSAIGFNSTASGLYSSAIGFGNLAEGAYTFSIGTLDTASEEGAVALGYHNKALSTYSFALGLDNIAFGIKTFSFGTNDTTSANGAMAFGHQNKSSGDFAFSFGINNKASGYGSIAIGSNNIASGDNSQTYGHFVSTNGYSGAILFGDNSSAGVKMNADQANQFKVRAAGGFVFHSNSLLTEQSTVYISPLTGNVGIGIANPTAKLHVNDILRLEPRNTPPNSANIGDIYFDNSIKKLKIFVGITIDNPSGWETINSAL